MVSATSLTAANKTRAAGLAHYAWVVGRPSEGIFFGVSLLLFTLSTVVTALCCKSMSGMEGMPMCGGWSMSIAWMRMPGQTWAGAAASFVGMWTVMMVAMMLPSFTPVLWRYRQSLAGIAESDRGRLTMMVGLGYFLVWTMCGLVVFPAGALMAAVEMERPQWARAVPIAAGVIVLIAGALQFTTRKGHHLRSCRAFPGRSPARARTAREAWRLGLNFGIHCGISCANLTAILLVLGVMDLGAMAAVTVAITAERLAPGHMRLPEAIGAISMGMGLIMIARAAGLV